MQIQLPHADWCVSPWFWREPQLKDYMAGYVKKCKLVNWLSENVAVSMSRIAPTQEYVQSQTVVLYRKHGIDTPLDGNKDNFRFGVMLRDSETVYLLNGHHRWYVAQEFGLSSFELDIIALKLTYEQMLERFEDMG